MKRVVLFLLLAVFAVPAVFAAASTSTRKAVHHSHARTVAHRTTRRTTRARVRSATLTRGRIHHRYRRHRYYERFTANSFATTDLTAGDVTAGEDPVVRQAAIDALGNMNGTVVAIDPSNGRILAMVNQKLALSSGAEPCSTIKLSRGAGGALMRASSPKTRRSTWAAAIT